MNGLNELKEVMLEINRREDALKNIYKFAEWMKPSGHSDFIFEPAKHHKVMLDQFQRIGDGDLKRLMIFLPPGSAKSTWGRVFKAWMLARNPNYQMIRVMTSQTLAERQARLLRATFQEPLFKTLTGQELDPNTQALAGFGTTGGGFVLSAGVGTSIVGMRGDLGIIDDPVPSWEYTQNPDNFEKAYEWYRSEYRTRLKPGAAEVLIMTRWNVHDLAGKLLASEEGDTWEVVRIPAECEDLDDPLGREIGERLWPEWFTAQMFEEQKRFPEMWSGMYQQRPYSQEGDFLCPDDFEIVDKAPYGGEYCAIDLALTERQSADATVIGNATMTDDGTLYITNIQKDRCTPEKTLQALMDNHAKYKFRECLIEDSPAEKVFRDLAHKFFRQKGKPIPLVPMPTRGQDKMARAQAFRGLVLMGAVKLVRGSWNDDLIREVTEFPYGKHDDVVDVCALLGRRAAKMGSKKEVKAPTRIEVEGTMQEIEGKTYTRATLDDLWSDNARSKPIIRL